MSGLTIGRVTIAGDTPASYSQSGNQLTITVNVKPTAANDTAEMKALRFQLSGLVDNVDEPVIPVTVAHDSSFDGYYKVLSVSVPTEPTTYVDGVLWAVTVQLERVIGGSNPRCEITTDSVLFPNDHSFTVPPAVIAVGLPSPNLVELDFRPSLTGATAISRASANGQTVTAYTLATPVATTRYRFPVTPALFYTGACTVEYALESTVAAANWRTAVGREIPRAILWRISNGLVRLTAADGSVSGQLEVWDASWETRNICHVTNGSTGPGIGGGSTATSSGATLSILQNGPECVVVRVVGTNLDWTYKINRGERHVTADWTCQTATKYGIGYTATVACSTLTGGIVTTANDANGNKLVFSGPKTQTTDVVNGRTNAATATTSGTVMAGVVLAGSGAISGDAAADLINQYIGSVASTQQVVTV